MASKRTWLAVHRYLGLAAGLFLLVQALSGTVMIWRDELLLASLPAISTSPEHPPVAIDTIVANARAAHPAAKIVRIDWPAAAGAPVIMRLFDPDQHILSFTAVSGALLSDAAARSYPSEWMYELHSRLLLGENGRWAIALDGVALLILAITGPFVWWPGRKHIRRALQVRWKGAASAPNLRIASCMRCFSLLVHRDNRNHRRNAGANDRSDARGECNRCGDAQTLPAQRTCAAPITCRNA